MKFIQYMAILFILVATLISCEQNKLISLTVVDKLTKQPLDSVYIEVRAGKKNDYTKASKNGYSNSAGKFETHIMIGCAFGCYDIYIKYTKSSYAYKSELNKTEGVVELEH